MESTLLGRLPVRRTSPQDDGVPRQDRFDDSCTRGKLWSVSCCGKDENRNKPLICVDMACSVKVVVVNKKGDGELDERGGRCNSGWSEVWKCGMQNHSHVYAQIIMYGHDS